MNAKEKKENKQIGTYYVETLKSGKKSYKKQLKLGVDQLTGKEVITTVSAKSFDELKLKVERRKQEFATNGKTVKHQIGITTFEQTALEWLALYKTTVKYNSYKRAEVAIRYYLIPAFGDYRIEKVTKGLIQNTVNEWAKKANETVTGYRRANGSAKDYKAKLWYVNAIMEHARSLEKIKINPATEIKVPRLKDDGKEKKIRFFEKDELKHFLQVLDDMKPKDTFSDFTCYRMELVKVYLPLLAFTGLRASEGMALKWEHIDFDNQQLTVKTTLNIKLEVEESPKTKGSRRTIPLDTETIQRLKRWKTYQAKAHLKLGLPRADFLFKKLDKDTFYSVSVIRQTFNLICKENNLPNISLHGLRHTHASVLLNAGVGYKEISQRLGHSDIKITMNTYAHLYKENKQSIPNIMLSFLSS